MNTPEETLIFAWVRRGWLCAAAKMARLVRWSSSSLPHAAPLVCVPCLTAPAMRGAPDLSMSKGIGMNWTLVALFVLDGSLCAMATAVIGNRKRGL